MSGPAMVEGRAEEARWALPAPDMGAIAGPVEPVAELAGPIATIPAPRQPITVTLACDEITTLDPRTHQPDFVTAAITYRPGSRLIDSKSLHAYIVGLRDHGYSMERLATVLARDVQRSCRPWWVEVTIHEKPRGGVAISATCRIPEQPR